MGDFGTGVLGTGVFGTGVFGGMCSGKLSGGGGGCMRPLLRRQTSQSHVGRLLVASSPLENCCIEVIFSLEFFKFLSIELKSCSPNAD